jgi:hypothetical protein
VSAAFTLSQRLQASVWKLCLSATGVDQDVRNEADDAAVAAAVTIAEICDALQQFVNGVETGMIDSPADETLANVTRQAKAALAKARVEA